VESFGFICNFRKVTSGVSGSFVNYQYKLIFGLKKIIRMPFFHQGDFF